MPLVVLDPIVLVNTAKTPSGTSAKLLTLLAYGRVSAYIARGAAAEHAAMSDIGNAGEKGVLEAHENAIAMRAALAASIPAGPTGSPPDDWRMAVSRELCGRVLNRIGELRDHHGIELDGGTVWGSIIAHASESLWETWAVRTIPDYTGVANLDGNITIHTALRVGASMVITKDRDVCNESAVPTTYSYSSPLQSSETKPLIAAHLDWLTESMSKDGFELEQVDPTVLERMAPTGSVSPRSWPPSSTLTRVRARLSLRRPE